MKYLDPITRRGPVLNKIYSVEKCYSAWMKSFFQYKNVVWARNYTEAENCANIFKINTWFTSIEIFKIIGEIRPTYALESVILGIAYLACQSLNNGFSAVELPHT